MDINAIGGGMQGFGAMQGIQGMQQDFQAVHGPKDMKEIGSLGQGINQQDKTEMSDELKDNPFSENKEIGVGNKMLEEAKAQGKEGFNKMVKDQIKAVLDKQTQEGGLKLADGREIPGQKDARIKSGIDSFKMLWDNCFKNNEQNLEPEVKEAAERLIQGDLNGAAQLINYDGNQQEGIGASQGGHANNIIAGIQGMGQVLQQ